MRRLPLLGILLAVTTVVAAACQKKEATITTNTTVVVNENVNSSTTGTFSTNTSATVNINTSVTTPESITITISSAGISPKTVTVASGTQVVFRNTDNASHEIASDPHPSHTDLSGFDGLIGSGGEYKFTFTKEGSWDFHDHLNPFDSKFKGTVNVQ